MKLELPIVIRRYGDILAIAQVLDDPALSAAAQSVDEAEEKLRLACARALSRVHPRLLTRAEVRGELRAERRALPVFPARREAWREEEGLPQRAPEFWERDFYLVEQRFKDVAQLRALGAGAPVWAPLAGEENSDQLAQPRAQLLAYLRRHERTLWMHRAQPDEFVRRQMQVEFEPMDLSEVPADALWMDSFGAVEEGDEQGEGASALAEVARLWTIDDPAARDARGISPVFGRAEMLHSLVELLAAARPAAVVLVGPERVGKTSIVKHLAWLSAAADEAQSNPLGRKIWFADPPRLTSTDPMSSGWQEQCRLIFNELERRDDILYLGQLTQALDAGKYVGSDYNLAQFLKPQLSERRLRIVAEATPEEWSRIEQRDVGFARAFHVLRVSDPPEAQSLEIAHQAAARLSQREQIPVDPAAVERAWQLKKRFAVQGSPLGQTIDFLSRSLKRAAQAFAPRLGERDLVERFCEETGLPPVLLRDEMSLQLDQVKAQLGRRVMGQPLAVERVAHVVGITKAGLAAADRPLGSFFFVGPTGVGKTELARALAEFLFGDEERLLRLDMSEYSHADAYSRLLGDAQRPGELTGPIRRQPFSVLLLDEVEKAHPNVYDLLLQVLGEARLSDEDGRTTRFQNTIVIMTSNLGVESLRPSIGFGQAAQEESIDQHFRREAERYFRPEFLARIDQFIPFQPLSREVVEAISARELARLSSRHGLSARDIQIVFDPAVAGWVARAGWEQKYGARPIKRVVEQQVAWPMARALAGARDLDPELTYSMRVAPDPADPEGALIFSLQPDSTAGPSRRQLLAQIERIAELRRRLERCLYAEVASEIAWQVQDFDISSQTEGFWELPDAADLAREAESGRQLITSALELSSELEAIEDLVREAYHTRAFALSADIDERVDELEPRLGQVFIALLRSAYQDPDRAVLFLPAQDPQDPWRAQLITWYQQLANQQGWELKMRRALPRAQRSDEAAVPAHQRREQLWEHARRKSGSVLALEFSGEAARAILSVEDGLHRRVAEDHNAAAEVFVLPESLDWPTPLELEHERPPRSEARTYNYRTMLVTLREVIADLPLQPDNPWPALWPHIEDLAWDMAGQGWW